MISFDEKTRDVLENAYLGGDASGRRLANLEILAPRTGERVVDLGCGPGFMTNELARAVGPEGRVYGLDPSQEMLDSARARCAPYSQTTIIEGTANAIPLEDQQTDGVVSVQVFEYVEDVPAALAEVRRVLKPGGRVVIGDMDFDTLAWFSDDASTSRSIT